MILFMLMAVMILAGCGNVYLSGDAATACENSAMDAYQAVQRANAAAATSQPTWVRPYLSENYKQWRDFVRANRRDQNWGPKLEGE